MVKSTEIKWPLSTSPGEAPQENAGRLINCYVEGGARQVWHRAPGCTQYGAETGTSGWTYWSPFEPWFNPPTVGTLPAGIFRGGIFVNNILYAVLGEKIYAIQEGGSLDLIGSIAGTDKVFLARNNKQPVPDIVLVCEAGVFVVTETSVSAYPDLDVGSPSCVVGHEGFFIFGYGNSDMIASDINTTSINTNNIAKANSNPDGILQIISYNGYLYVMGTATIEVWGLPLNTTGFPYNRLGYNITPGLIAHHAVAGMEPEFGKPPVYVASDHTVRVLSNEPVDISSPQLQRFIRAETDNSNIEASVYVVDGIPFWQVSGTEFTWVLVFDGGYWHERMSYLLDRSRLTGSVFAFDRWLCGDILENGYMLEMTRTVATEIDDPLIAEMESLPVEDFPAFVVIPRADFEFTSGVGISTGHDPDETNPYAEVSWSNDGGVTWTPPLFRELGRQQKSLRRITVRRTGMSGAQGRRWRIAVPAAVHFGFIGGNMDAYFTEK
jgi:hypothetical protein